MEPTLIIFIIIGLIVLFLILGAPTKSFRLLGQGIVKLLIGAILLFFLNVFGNQFGLHIPINLSTTAVSGLLGIPGLISLVVIQLWIM